MFCLGKTKKIDYYFGEWLSLSSQTDNLFLISSDFSHLLLWNASVAFDIFVC